MMSLLQHSQLESVFRCTVYLFTSQNYNTQSLPVVYLDHPRHSEAPESHLQAGSEGKSIKLKSLLKVMKGRVNWRFPGGFELFEKLHVTQIRS